MPAARPFSTVEDDFLRTHARSMPHRDIATELDRSISGVRKRICALGLAREMRRWTAEEDQAIRDGAAARKHLQDVAACLGRRVSETSTRAKHLGLAPWKQHRRRDRTKGGHVIAGFDVASGRYILEHRVVMAKAIGRPLADSEIVHHINTVKTSNEPGNLYLCSGPAEHQRIHRSLEQLVPELMAAGVIRFNRDRGAYEVCEISRWRPAC